ncbi:MULTISPECIES: MFS transporter [Streptomyces]|uniref:MFS transporter n=1 Tax=Streptomyces TaxID=1883 RepID=UPI0019650B82|nr:MULTISPECIES: MFS transporter [Streptomyces]QRX94983.1 MFS transporter [Streptomyces noursei]UJB46183.1 MFS transporter [Streptomyces sp. A1-5]
MEESSEVVLRGERRTRRWALHAMLCAVAIGAAGEAMTVVAVPWFVLKTTGSVASTGLIVAVVAIGSGLVGFAAGPLVDRWGFRTMAGISYLLSGAAALCVPLCFAAGWMNFPTLLALVLAARLLDAPGAAAVTGLVPSLAASARIPLERGNALLSGVHQTAQLCGPPLGGAAMAVLGTEGTFYLTAIACVLAAAVIALCVAPGDRGLGDGPAKGYLSDLCTGLRTLRDHRLLRALTLSSTAFNALDGGISGVILVTFSYEHLGSAASLGVLLTCFGLGTLAGTLGYAAVGHRFGRRTLYVRSGLLVGGLLAPLAALPSLPVAAGLLAVVGVVAAPVGPLRTSVLQQQVPGEQYGRVTSAIDTLSLAAVPLGASATVALIGGAGLPTTILIIAGVYLLIVLGCWAAPALRDM